MENMEGSFAIAAMVKNPALARQAKVLLIDDDPLFRALMVRLGSSLGIDVEAYESIVEMEPFSRINDYDGAIFDYYLGLQDGMDIVSHLKPFFEKIPTILVSADADIQSVVTANPKSGVSAFAHKSLGAVKILEQMRDLLAKSKQ